MVLLIHHGSRYPNLKTTSACGKVSVFLARLLSYSRRMASLPSLVTAIWTARVVHSLRRTSAICTALASAQTLMASRARNGNKRHIDMELQSALRVFQL